MNYNTFARAVCRSAMMLRKKRWVLYILVTLISYLSLSNLTKGGNSDSPSKKVPVKHPNDWQKAQSTYLSRLPVNQESGIVQVITEQDLQNLKKAIASWGDVAFNKIQLSMSYLPHYKNPCWVNRQGELLCLPYFFIAGFPRCGTTDLFDKVAIHPKILKTKKEPSFWSRYRFSKTDPTMKDLQSYASYYGAFMRNQSKPSKRDGSHEEIVTDATVSTAWDSGKLFTYGTLRNHHLLNVHFIKSVLPDARFVLAVRNPTARLYSDFQFFHRNSTKQTFHTWVKEAIDDFNQCLNSSNTNMAWCLYSPKSAHKTLTSRLRIGLYHHFIEHLIDAGFKLGLHIKVIRLEDYIENKASNLNSVFDFLDLESLTERQFAERGLYKDVYFARNSDPIQSTTKKLLDDFYRPYNARLAELLGDEKYRYR